MRDLQFRNRMMAQGFAPIPKVVLKSPKISMQAKTAFAQLIDYAWYGEAFPGRDRLAEENGVHPNTIDKALKELKEAELITIVRRGHMKTNLYVIEDFMSEAMIMKLAPIGMEFTPVPDQPDQPPPSTLPPPEIPYERIIKYLNEKAGTQFKHNSKDTRRYIKARFADGYTTKEFKKVIDFKVNEWKSDAHMMQWLRPKTLFSTNFESYLNAAGMAKGPTPKTNGTGDDFMSQYGYRGNEPT